MLIYDNGKHRQKTMIVGISTQKSLNKQPVITKLALIDPPL